MTKPTTSDMAVEQLRADYLYNRAVASERGEFRKMDKLDREFVAAIEAHYAAIRKADMEYVAGEIDLYDSKEVRQYIKSAQERMAERLNNERKTDE